MTCINHAIPCVTSGYAEVQFCEIIGTKACRVFVNCFPIFCQTRGKVLLLCSNMKTRRIKKGIKEVQEGWGKRVVDRCWRSRNLEWK